MLENGYMVMVECIFDYLGIMLYLGMMFGCEQVGDYVYVFYSGLFDGYFDYEDGWFGYWMFDFECFIFKGDYQGCVVMNYGEVFVFYMCIIEYKYFVLWESYEGLVCYCEYVCVCELGDMFYYLICFVEEKVFLVYYVEKVKVERGVIFVGWFGIYCYFDMDVIICEVLDVVWQFRVVFEKGEVMFVFVVLMGQRIWVKLDYWNVLFMFRECSFGFYVVQFFQCF